MKPVLSVGLTGGIAAGKSTIAAYLAELGALVLDADRIAHEVTSPGGSAFDEVVGRFGVEILDSEGHIDRRALGRVVFGDDGVRVALNAIVHPKVRDEVERRIAAYREAGEGRVAVVDAPLLVETGYGESFDRIIVARCTRDTQIRRLLERDGMTLEEATARINVQAPLEQKLAAADYIIDTEVDLDETLHQTRTVYVALLKEYENRFGRAS